MNWTLAEHGDGVEQSWGEEISALFPNYEIFWVLHVVPLTYRVSNPSDILLRAGIPSHLDEQATYHHRVFEHLTVAHDRIFAQADHWVYDFYARLNSACDAVDRFLGVTNNVLAKYKGRPMGKRRAMRLARYGDGALFEDFETVRRKVAAYRTREIHTWGFPMIGTKIPARAYLSSWTGLGTLASIADAPDYEERIGREFVDAEAQGRADLEEFERVSNRIWQVILTEIDELREPERYAADQAINKDRTSPAAFASGSAHFSAVVRDPGIHTMRYPSSKGG